MVPLKGVQETHPRMAHSGIHHCIGQPLKMENFLNSPSLFKLIHLLLDNIRMLFK